MCAPGTRQLDRQPNDVRGRPFDVDVTVDVGPCQHTEIGRHELERCARMRHAQGDCGRTAAERFDATVPKLQPQRKPAVRDKRAQRFHDG